ncbi:MAG: hypothetical protein CVT73_12285 [Alphaproteobacteria bacterium HGW-Alphaproteobacteria-12]|nr:MAG: hypothetical protein CVT73_12285 [Alphaproteobacteria bacterium HGW-Alphaproteobacteria-12]
MTNVHQFDINETPRDPIDRTEFGLIALSALSELLNASPARLEISGDNLSILLDIVHKEINDAARDMSAELRNRRWARA